MGMSVREISAEIDNRGANVVLKCGLELKNRASDDPSCIKSVITGDETSVCGYDSEGSTIAMKNRKR